MLYMKNIISEDNMTVLEILYVIAMLSIPLPLVIMAISDL